MDSVTIVGVAGVAGTLGAGLLAPVIAGRITETARLRSEWQLLYTEALKHQSDLRVQGSAARIGDT